MAYTEYESYTTGDNGSHAIYGTTYWEAQNFTITTAHIIKQVSVKVYRIGSPGDLTVEIYNTDASGFPEGGLIGTGTVDGDTFTTDNGGSWEDVDLTTTAFLASGTKYAMVLKASDGDNSNAVYWRWDSSGSYSGGIAFHSTDEGSSWSNWTGYDYLFKDLGDLISIPTTDVYSTKKLVAAGGLQVYYESSAGTMASLAASVGTLDTTDFIDMFELFGKVFIVNNSIKKVVDFDNVKITTGTIEGGGEYPRHGTVLTGGTSGATMVVDYITATSGSCTIYGKKTSSASFANAETVTGTVTDADDVSFTTTAAETSGPHYYNWTVYGSSSTFGTMPDYLTLGCSYNGRAVVSGNKNYPHQWYMTRQGNPWDFQYVANDAQSPIAGNDSDCGEAGDVIRALVPYGNDFLLIAGDGSLLLMDGDPAANGTLDLIDEHTGIFGQKAWCKDSKGNLYFYSNAGGLYSMAGGRELPVNMSGASLPNLVDDWATNPSTHRIVLTYDPKRFGIILSRTTLSSGANLNYWYDLKTEGFYPETYPNACGIFCSTIYKSDSTTTNGLILGCNDGYLRNFYDDDKDDDSGASDTAISSYITIEFQLNEEDDKEGKLTSLTFELAGGASGGAFSDTDGLSYEIHVGKDAETVLEDIQDGATALFSGTLSGTGRKNRIRTRARGKWLGLKLYNSTATETWAVNRINGTVIPAGRVR